MHATTPVSGVLTAARSAQSLLVSKRARVLRSIAAVRTASEGGAGPTAAQRGEQQHQSCLDGTGNSNSLQPRPGSVTAPVRQSGDCHAVRGLAANTGRRSQCPATIPRTSG